MNTAANGKEDILQIFLNILKRNKIAYCMVGGLAVNAYVEPVVSLDLAVVIENKDIDKVSKKIVDKGLKVERFEHLADIIRLMEEDPSLEPLIPSVILEKLK